MTSHSHQTAPTQYVEANGIRFAYRRFGKGRHAAGLNFPPPYMLQEVSVQLNNFKAQYGRNVGSVFNALTRSGSNGIHGTVWEYLQNAAFDASDYGTGVNPHLVSNQFGATIGGPIIHDKAFFFGAYEGIRFTQAANTYLALAHRCGTFREPDR